MRPLTLDETRTKLTERFGRILTLDGDYSGLYSIRQRQHETVDELADRLGEEERRLVHPPPANVRLTTFLQALRADLQRPVRTQEPQTLEAALHEARKAERIADSLYSGGRREQPFRRDEAGTMTGNVPERGLLGPDGTPWRTRRGRDAAEAGEGARYQAGREAGRWTDKRNICGHHADATDRWSGAWRHNGRSDTGA